MTANLAKTRGPVLQNTHQRVKDLTQDTTQRRNGESKLCLSFNYYAQEICETKMLLVCKPLAQGHIVPEMLEATVYERKQATCFQSPKQVCLTQLYQMSLIT